MTNLKIVVARVAEVRGAEAEENGDGAAITTFVLQKVRAVFRAHLGPGDVGTAAADELGRVVIRIHARLEVASSLTAVISLVAFEANVVGVAMHSVTSRIRVKTSALRG